MTAKILQFKRNLTVDANEYCRILTTYGPEAASSWSSYHIKDHEIKEWKRVLLKVMPHWGLQI